MDGASQPDNKDEAELFQDQMYQIQEEEDDEKAVRDSLNAKNTNDSQEKDNSQPGQPNRIQLFRNRRNNMQIQIKRNNFLSVQKQLLQGGAAAARNRSEERAAGNLCSPSPAPKKFSIKKGAEEETMVIDKSSYKSPDRSFQQEIQSAQFQISPLKQSRLIQLKPVLGQSQVLDQSPVQGSDEKNLPSIVDVIDESSEQKQPRQSHLHRTMILQKFFRQGTLNPVVNATSNELSPSDASPDGKVDSGSGRNRLAMLMKLKKKFILLQKKDSFQLSSSPSKATNTIQSNSSIHSPQKLVGSPTKPGAGNSSNQKDLVNRISSPVKRRSKNQEMKVLPTSYKEYLRRMEKNKKQQELNQLYTWKRNQQMSQELDKIMEERRNLRDHIIPSGKKYSYQMDDRQLREQLRADSQEDAYVRLNQTNLDNQCDEEFIKLDSLEKQQILDQHEDVRFKLEKQAHDNEVSFQWNEIWSTKNIVKFEEEGRISIDVIQLIENEYGKKDRDRNYLILNNAVKDLKFFRKLHKGVRSGILEASRFIKFEKNETVFKQGDYGDKMYIILRGSVNIITTQSTIGGNIEYVITSLYDGQHFGDLAMMGTMFKNYKVYDAAAKENELMRIMEKQIQAGTDMKSNILSKILQQTQTSQTKLSDPGVIKTQKEVGEGEFKKTKTQYERTKRAATVKTCETCFLLELPREKYSTILLNSIQPDLEKKLCVLLMIPFLKDAQPYSLLPLADLLQVRRYQLGDYIVKQGEEMKFLGIIASGLCQVIEEERQQRDIKSLLVKPERQYFKFQDHCDPTTKIEHNGERQTKVERQNDFYYLPNEFCEERTFNYCNKQITADNRLEFTNHVVFKTITSGQMFGIRCMLTADEINASAAHAIIKDRKRITFDKESGRKDHAVLSLIASTATVEVLQLDISNFYNIPEQLQREFKSGILNTPDFDCYNIDRNKNEDKYWNTLKQDLVKGLILQKLKAKQIFG